MPPLPLVLLTNPIHPDAVAMLAPYARVVVAPDTAASSLRALAPDAAGMIVRAQLPDDILDHAPKLRGIVRHGVGLDFVPLAAATARGIPVANLPGSNTGAVAEYVLSALLALRRRLADVDAGLRRDGWLAAKTRANDLAEIGGTTLGILGMGEIGRRVAGIARHGFGLRVLGASRTASDHGGLVEPVDVATLFSGSDAVVIACPLTDATRGLVDAALIGQMRPGAVLINVARGPIVVTDAVVAALNAGRLGGAALDVFEHQPLAPDHPLHACPNLLLTPHVAGTTATSLRAMGLGAVEEMLRILSGERPRNLVNPAALER
ncbi:hydroxyacid dehydrogenase [Methylobacterium sp. WL30]|uniref:NAD(P)-dependent oxidoreductase n=1 Tax=unclassified Methylobacterium TaxID=2615210 RepID=UPI0011CBC450|nr:MULTISPECIES: NAD(P)-dependent oxidoreductase [unclassified Methylobacterium]TXM88321.1 hydroxyacid dehydrogenase [Methylobacterium sp. WL116]TXN26839.1 hydroxyacid dehydrogenase [Methylobacterium sp. WL93]TXN47707.1 hydroxyacid dehydrogenase [Methylobacterium sp. WL119]TXN65394.1 hydroxyacid dehydrogenase [Methylobacterium sp. WL30]